MKNSLFIGNGLNRCLKNSISWGDLMEYVSKELEVSYHSEIAMPLEFERMVNEYLEKANQGGTEIYSDIKDIICRRTNDVRLPENALHYEISKLKMDSVITTNYDYLLEYVYNNDYEYISGLGRNKYLFESTSKQKGVEFYHAHGLSGAKNTLCLGYEHYMGVVQHLRESLNSKTDGEMKIKRIICGDEKPKYTWGEKFYTDNIYFVGFQLDECESDIWWLLTHRAYLYYSNIYEMRWKLKNKIIFYDILDMRPSGNEQKEKSRKLNVQRKLNRYELLRKLNVIVREYELKNEDDTYQETYLKIFDDIRKES